MRCCAEFRGDQSSRLFGEIWWFFDF